MSLNLKKFAKRIFDSEPIYIEIYNKCFKELSIYIAWFDRNIIDGLINVIPIKILSTSKFLMSMQDGIARKYAIRVVLFFVLLALFGAVFVNISNAGVLVL